MPNAQRRLECSRSRHRGGACALRLAATRYPRMRFGIDFGTTHTVVATCDRGNYPIVAFNDSAGDAHEFVPTVVAERAGELRFGHEALELAADPSWTVLRSFKRLLGAGARPDATICVGSTEIAVVELISRFLDA